MESNQRFTERIIRLKEVMARTGLSRSTIYLHIKEQLFPKPINLGVRSVGWLESEIDAWIDEKVGKRQG